MEDKTKASSEIIIGLAPWVLILIIVLIILNRISKIFGDDEEAKKAAEKYVDEVRKDIDFSKLTQSESVYVGWANQLYNAMKGVGTDSALIESIFQQIRSNDDLRYLIVKFGVRGDEDLIGWLNDDLPIRSSVILGGTSINYLNEVLKENGLTERI